MRYYFAYGSNMSTKQMRKRCKDNFEIVGIAYIEGYRFVYDGYSRTWKGAVANIVPSEGDRVWGVLYKIGQDCEETLDKFEGVKRGIYSKRYLKVKDEKGKEYEALVYMREPQPVGEPSEDYRKTVVEGSEEHKLPKDYIDRFLK